MMRVNRKFNILLSLILAVVAIFSFTGCFLFNGDDEVNQEKLPTLTVNQAVISIKPYETFDIIATWTGEGEVSWTTKDASIATVDNGKVTGVSVGQTVIVVSAGEYSKDCYVTVRANDEVPTVSVLNADNGTVQLCVGDNYNLNVNVSFDSKKVDATLNYLSSNEEILSVDASGKIVAKKVGEANVFVSGSWREFDDTVIYAVVKVIVKTNVSFELFAEQSGIYAVNTIDGETFTNQTQLTPNLTIKGTNYSEGFTFESSDSSVLSVDQNGLVSGLKVGTADITCYYEYDGEELFAKKTIEVLPIVRDKTLSEEFILELSTMPTAAALDFVFNGQRETVKIVDVTENEVLVGIDENDKTIVDNGLITTGERVWEIHNDAYAYRVNLLVVDYVIDTASELKSILPSEAREKDAYIILGNDILSVGNYSGWQGFSGTFDGRGHVISDINIQSRGLFGGLDGSATIKNVAMSNVTLNGTSSVFGVQANSVLIDNVSVWISGATPTETTPIGGLVFQIGGSVKVRNSLVYAMGVKDMNFGVVTGAWWGGSYEIVNSYFITDGTPCGNSYVTGTTEHNTKGPAENEKGSWDYIYENRQAFEQELAKTDSKVNLGGFDANIWDISQKTMPIFKNDQGFKAILSEKVEGSKNGGELFYFSKNVTTATGYAGQYVQDGYYKVALPEAINGTVTAVNLGANAIENFVFDASAKTLKVPVSSLESMSCGQYNMLITTTVGSYRCEVTVADSVLYNGEDVRTVLNNQETLGASGVGNDVYVILDGDITWDWTIFPSGWGKHLYGTIDGKGYSITNMRVTAYLFHTIQGGSAIKNIAFLNVSYGGDSSFFCLENGAFTVENVAITYSAGVCIGLVKNMVGNVVVRNTILVCNSTSYGYVNTYNSAKTLTLENSYCVTSTAAIKTPVSTEDANYINAQATVCSDLATLLTKSENLNAFSSTYWSVENGSVLFGGNVVLAAQN